MNGISYILEFFFQKTALHMAIEEENAEIVKVLFRYPKIDINIPIILILKCIKFLNKSFDFILIQIT